MLDLMCDGYDIPESPSDTKAWDSRWSAAYTPLYPKLLNANDGPTSYTDFHGQGAISKAY